MTEREKEKGERKKKGRERRKLEGKQKEERMGTREEDRGRRQTELLVFYDFLLLDRLIKCFLIFDT